MTSLSYVGEFVKNNDPDRFLLSLFCDASCREALWAIFAFNHEISKTREVVSESTLGLIRLQWWRDEIVKIYDGNLTQGHEVLTALNSAIKEYNLPQKYFHDLIYAREFDLENVLPSDMKGFVNYCDFTCTPLMRLAIIIAGGKPDNEGVQDIAINYSIAGLLRSVPHHAKQGRAYLPENLLKETGISKDELFSFQKTKETASIVESIVKSRPRSLKTNHILLKSSNILADIYFKQIQGQKFDVFSSKVQVTPAFKILRLFIRTKYLR
tara:strand:- start:1875 stop:2678 length:804 start_codon:yes stop_codon:yes gene_type:complete